MSLGDDAACAPSATSWSTTSFRVSNTVSWCVASIRRRAIGKPIFPRPTNPISMVVFPLALRHCDERSDEAIHSFFVRRGGLLRFARNDG
jgi:hypothetical protein